MQYVILDLEWNVTFSKKKKKYFNEIIEVGAVRLKEDRTLDDTFQAYVGAQISKKLCSKVAELTNLEFSDIKNGQPFSRVMAKFSRWVGSSDTVVMTWSNTDLHVLMENYQYYDPAAEAIPFLKKYVDLQKYCQTLQWLPLAQQVGLAAFAEQISVPVYDLQQHSALDDSIIEARCFQKMYDAKRFPEFVRDASKPEFYRRMLFKNQFITDINSEEIDRKHLRFRCQECGRQARRISKWRKKNNAFFADFCCQTCGVKFTARIQAKKTYDAVRVNRRILPFLPKNTPAGEGAASAAGQKQ